MTKPAAPVADRRPYDVVSPHGTRDDPYYWLRDDKREAPDVLAYIHAENAYTEAVLAPVKELEGTLFAEMRARIKEDDSSVPTLERGYWYYVRFETGKQYPIYARRAGTTSAPEEILLDGNALAVGNAFYKIASYEVSPDGRWLAWAEDTVGRNQFVLRIKDLATGEVQPDTAENISGAMGWANDNKTLFYVGKDAVTLRTDRVFRHEIGGAHELVYREADEQFYTSLSSTKSRRYLAITMSATEQSEVRLIDADAPRNEPRVYIPRADRHLYGVDHLNDRFVVHTNHEAKNFRLVEVPPGKELARGAWIDVIGHSPDTLVEDVALFDTFIAASVRTDGLRKVLVVPHDGDRFFIDAQDAAYMMMVSDTPEPATTRVRYTYTSLTRPPTTFELDVVTRERMLLKQQPVPTYDPSLYESAYVHAIAADGARVPISLAWKKGTPRDGSAPLFVYGYGSYGISQEPVLSGARTSLLDRGWVYAIAHVRGGQEMGRHWYEDGKLQKKWNTFRDFISCTEYLVAHQWGARDKVVAMGGSAGGLLMGTVVNERPDLYRGIISFVPFVDVVTTMLDESIPLTTNEYDEWGNPSADKRAYDLMLGYSPYDNIRAQAYPAIYVHTGLWDSQVQYWEPAKWIAKLRVTNTGTAPILLDMNMSAGHGGASGRFDALREIARAFAFAITQTQ
ncbi:MAG: S9 family peptidase [Kofleriaceae bacterium]